MLHAAVPAADLVVVLGRVAAALELRAAARKVELHAGEQDHLWRWARGIKDLGRRPGVHLLWQNVPKVRKLCEAGAGELPHPLKERPRRLLRCEKCRDPGSFDAQLHHTLRLRAHLLSVVEVENLKAFGQVGLGYSHFDLSVFFSFVHQEPQGLLRLLKARGKDALGGICRLRCVRDPFIKVMAQVPLARPSKEGGTSTEELSVSVSQLVVESPDVFP
mmetsp:Transcript_112711/g.268615  ORF Transcript_112711/g.268615 Transcript_112711/m.268615 type:complete len:218 (-) Transcript_112711:337-990(-)